MYPQCPARRPLAPTSINAILASPISSPGKSQETTITPSSENQSLVLPPIKQIYAPNACYPPQRIPPQYLPPIREAISPALRNPSPAGLSNTSISHSHFSSTPPHNPAIRPPLRLCSPLGPPLKRKLNDISTCPIDLERYEVRDNCDQIRHRIHTLLRSGEMKMTEFIRDLDVNSNSYSRFMGQTGPDKGFKSEVYVKAWRFFKNREMQGIQIPVKKVKKEDEERRNDVSHITLDGEHTISVKVFDSCDEIRRKIRAHLADPAVTQAGFLREIAKTYPDGRKIQSKVLNDFLGKRGKYVGNTTAVYYSSYVFFEKIRLRDGKEKTKHRLEMEDEWMEDGGIDVKHRDNGRAYPGPKF